MSNALPRPFLDQTLFEHTGTCILVGGGGGGGGEMSSEVKNGKGVLGPFARDGSLIVQMRMSWFFFHWFYCHCDCCFCLHTTSVVQFCPTLFSIITSPSRPSFSFSSKISSRHTMPSVGFCSSSRHRHFRCRHRHQPRPRSSLSFFSLLLTFLLPYSFSMCGCRSGFYPNCTFLETSSACKSTT